MTEEKAVSICKLLYSRERGFPNQKKLYETGALIADTLLVKSDNIDKTCSLLGRVGTDPRSIYSFDFSRDGTHAAVADTNRSISIINVAHMKNIAHIENTGRTVWTMSFHPYDPNIIATGNLGGKVNVYKQLDLYRSIFEILEPITSLCFHPKTFHILFAQNNRVSIWNWENNEKLLKYYANHNCPIRYLKVVPNTFNLITGIEKQQLQDICNDKIINASQSDMVDFNTSKPNINCIDKQLKIIFSLVSGLIFDLELWYTNHSNFLLLLNKWKLVLTNLQRIKYDLNIVAYNNNMNNKSLDLVEVNKSLEILLKRLNNAWNTDVPYSKCNEYTVYSVLFKDIQENVYNNQIDLHTLSEIITKLWNIFGIFPEVTTNVSLTNSTLEMFIKKLNDVINRYKNNIQLERSSTKEPHIIQLWNDSEDGRFPNLKLDWCNTITTCNIHNDSTIAISRCGSMLCSYKKYATDSTITIHSLKLSNLGDVLYTCNLETGMVSVSFSPSNKYLLVGLRSQECIAHIFELGLCKQMTVKRHCINYNKENNINCIIWSPTPSDGILIGFQNLQLGYIRSF